MGDRADHRLRRRCAVHGAGRAVSFALADNVSALAIAGQLGVPFSLLLAVVIFKERIRWPRITAVILCFLGVAVMGFDPAIAHESIALWLTVAASLAWAGGNLLFRQLKGINVLTIHAWLALVTIPILFVAALIFEPANLANIPNLKLSTWGWLVYSGIGASLIGHGGMSWLFQRYPVSTVSPLTLPTPLLSVGVAILGVRHADHRADGHRRHPHPHRGCHHHAAHRTRA